MGNAVESIKFNDRQRPPPGHPPLAQSCCGEWTVRGAPNWMWGNHNAAALGTQPPGQLQPSLKSLRPLVRAAAEAAERRARVWMRVDLLRSSDGAHRRGSVQGRMNFSRAISRRKRASVCSLSSFWQLSFHLRMFVCRSRSEIIRARSACHARLSASCFLWSTLTPVLMSHSVPSMSGERSWCWTVSNGVIPASSITFVLAPARSNSAATRR